MWICLNDAFFSIVDEKAKNATSKRPPRRKATDRDTLVVRARRDGDIERVFAQPAKIAGHKLVVEESIATDYRYRTRVPRALVKDVMAAEIDRVIYGNFKDSVEDDDLHRAYSQVWSVMFRLQEPVYQGRDYGSDLFSVDHL